MSDDRSAEDEHRVLRFRQRTSANPPDGDATPELDLRKYESGDEPDDYRSRMIVNVVALCFLAALIGGGLWIANTMAQMRKSQDCVLSGRRNCAPIDTTIER